MLPIDTSEGGGAGGGPRRRTDGGDRAERDVRADRTADDGGSTDRTDSGDAGRSDRGAGAGVVGELLGSTEPERVLDQGELLEILGNRRRRLLWALLHRREGAVDLADASRRVAARERGVDSTAVTSEERKSVYASLYQHHCPVMAEAGAIEFDRERSTVEAVAAAERQRFLDLAVDPRAVGRAVAGSLAAAAGVVGVGWALGAPVLGALSLADFAVTVGVSAAVSVGVYAAVVSRRYPVRLGDLLRAADGTDG